MAKCTQPELTTLRLGRSAGEQLNRRMSLPNHSLSDVQLELRKLCATDPSVEDLEELKEQLAQFYGRKSVGKANGA